MVRLLTFSGLYRAIELTDGWRGPIAVNQTLFLALDALLMVRGASYCADLLILIVFSYIIYHPGFVVGEKR